MSAPVPESDAGKVSVDGRENRVVGPGGHHNFLGDVHGGLHVHLNGPARSGGEVLAAVRSEVLAEWARHSRRRLIERWAAAGLDDEMAACLADDPTIGNSLGESSSLCDQGVVLLEGPYGSGKSVTGERLHQVDLHVAMRDQQAPAPVYLDARAVPSALADAVTQACALMGVLPDQVGVRLVLDGLDEVTLTRASRLLAEARTLTRVWPRSRVVATVRPGLPEAKDHEVVAHLPMTPDEAAALARRVGGLDNHAPVASQAVQEALQLPLFVIIAALSYRDGFDVPSSRIDFLENLVQRALRRPGTEIHDIRATLARLARLAIEAGGPVPAGEAGSDAEIDALVASRLVVRRGRTLAFGLPVLEQYFGGKSVQDKGVPASALADSVSLERWRYPLALAIAAASWERSEALLQPVVERFPGIAAWLLHESIPDNRRGSHAGVQAHCGEQIQGTLGTWLPALAPASGLLPVGIQGTPPLVLAVHVQGDGLLTVARHRPLGDGQTGIVRLTEPPVEMRALQGPDGDHRYGYPPADYPAWPWRWSLDWIAEGISKLMERKRLPVQPSGPAEAELLWSRCRTLVDGSFMHEPLSAAEIITRIRQILRPGLVVHHFQSGWRAQAGELEALLGALVAGEGVSADGNLHCPFPAPDLPSAPTSAFYGHYSDQHLVAYLSHIHQTALEIYQNLCETWFPHLVPTLGLACIMPVQFSGYATRATQNDKATDFLLHTYSYETKPLPVGSRSTATFDYSSSGIPPEEWQVTLQRHGELRRTIEQLHPTSAPWAHPRAGTAAFPVPSDTPATNLAYQWLWDDLRDLRLVSGRRPV